MLCLDAFSLKAWEHTAVICEEGTGLQLQKVGNFVELSKYYVVNLIFSPCVEWSKCYYSYNVMAFVLIASVQSAHTFTHAKNEWLDKNFWIINSINSAGLKLKTLDTIGNCQRPVFSLGVSQHLHKTTNLCKFELDLSSKLRNNNERWKLCAFKMLDFMTSKSNQTKIF